MTFLPQKGGCRGGGIKSVWVDFANAGQRVQVRKGIGSAPVAGVYRFLTANAGVHIDKIQTAGMKSFCAEVGSAVPCPTALRRPFQAFASEP